MENFVYLQRRFRRTELIKLESGKLWGAQSYL
jgi:hypothetical protein